MARKPQTSFPAHAQQHPALTGGTAAFISGEESRYPAQQQGHEALGHALDEMGLDYEPTRGQYDGKPERSYIVLNPTMDQAIQLGKRFGQEAVVFTQGGRHQYVYTNGTNDGLATPPTPGKAEKYRWHDSQPTDNYTVVPGPNGEPFGWVTLNMDFTNPLVPARPIAAPLQRSESPHAIAARLLQEGVIDVWHDALLNLRMRELAKSQNHVNGADMKNAVEPSLCKCGGSINPVVKAMTKGEMCAKCSNMQKAELAKGLGGMVRGAVAAGAMALGSAHAAPLPAHHLKPASHVINHHAPGGPMAAGTSTPAADVRTAKSPMVAPSEKPQLPMGKGECKCGKSCGGACAKSEIKMQTPSAPKPPQAAGAMATMHKGELAKALFSGTAHQDAWSRETAHPAGIQAPTPSVQPRPTSDFDPSLYRPSASSPLSRVKLQKQPLVKAFGEDMKPQGRAPLSQVKPQTAQAVKSPAAQLAPNFRPASPGAAGAPVKPTMPAPVGIKPPAPAKPSPLAGLKNILGFKKV